MAKPKTEIQELSEFIRDNMVTRKEFYEFTSKMDAMQETLDAHTQTLADHTRDLTMIKNDLAIHLDKRLQLEVRVEKIETRLAKR